MAMRDDHCYSGNGCLNRAAPPAVVITKPAGIPAWLCAACAAGQVQVRAFHDAMIALFGPTGEVQFEATEHAPPLAELNQGLSPIAAATQQELDEQFLTSAPTPARAAAVHLQMRRRASGPRSC